MPQTKTLPFLDRLLAWSLRTRPSAPARYGLSTMLIVTIGLVRAALIPTIVPWLLFIPAVLAIALLLGRGAGLYASLLAAVVAGVSLGRASNPLWLTNAQWIGSFLFVIVTTVTALVTADLRAVFARAQLLAGEKEVAHALLVDREAFLASVLASSTDCIKVLDADGRLTFMSEGGQRVMEVSDFNAIAGCPWPDFWQDAGNLEAVSAIQAAREGRSHSFIAEAATMAGTLKWWHVAVSPIIGQGGQPARILSVSRDISDQKRAETDMQFLNGELAHRLKNVLAVAQSVAQQTLRNAPDMPTAAKALSARLVALGAATDVLTGGSWQSADLCELATRALKPHGEINDRILIQGPTVTLKPSVTIAFALALHELATNAAKYGALSNEAGRVVLSWAMDGIGDDASFSLNWREHDGPPVSPPLRKGFGSMLIERSLRSYCSGTAGTDYRPDGLVFELQAKRAAIAAVSKD